MRDRSSLTPYMGIAAADMLHDGFKNPTLTTDLFDGLIVE